MPLTAGTPKPLASCHSCTVINLAVRPCRAYLRRDTPTHGPPRDTNEFWSLLALAAKRMGSPGAGLLQSGQEGGAVRPGECWRLALPPLMAFRCMSAWLHLLPGLA